MNEKIGKLFQELDNLTFISEEAAKTDDEVLKRDLTKRFNQHINTISSLVNEVQFDLTPNQGKRILIKLKYAARFMLNATFGFQIDSFFLELKETKTVNLLPDVKFSCN